MSKRNPNNDEKLLIWAIILLFTGFGSGIGGILLTIYIIKKIFGNKDVDNLISEKINRKISDALGGTYKSKTTYTETTTSSNNDAKVIYADKVETVNEKKEPVKAKVETDVKLTEEGYTTQEILDKLDYYNQHVNLTNEEILEKISILNKMLLSLSLKIDKIELQNDIKDINKTIEKILKTLKKKKSKIKNINNFATYYLPVTLKILIKYDEVENLKLDSPNSKEFMATVEDKIKMIKTSFQSQLESLYTDDFDDVEAELNVLETMLKSDGFNDLDDFNLRGKK